MNYTNQLFFFFLYLNQNPVLILCGSCIHAVELDRGNKLMWKLKEESYCNSSQSRTMRCFLWKTQITVSQHWNWQDLEIPQNRVNCVLSLLSSACQKQGVLGVFTVEWEHFFNSVSRVCRMTSLTSNVREMLLDSAMQVRQSVCRDHT